MASLQPATPRSFASSARRQLRFLVAPSGEALPAAPAAPAAVAGEPLAAGALLAQVLQKPLAGRSAGIAAGDEAAEPDGRA